MPLQGTDRGRRAFFFACGLLAALGCAREPLPPVILDCERPGALVPLEELSFLAHAGGSPQGLEPVEIYTNSRAAFEVSYRNGFRAFEFDLVVLGDGTVVAAHDGYEDRYGLGKPFREAERADVEGRRLDGTYPLLFVDDLVTLMAEHPDVWLILDSKWEHTEVARAFVEATDDDSILQRIVPHLASEDHLRQLEDLYPFPEHMVAVYRWPQSDSGMVQTMTRLGLDNVMMWWDSRWSEATQTALDQAGLHAWVHTPSELEVVEAFLDRGVRLYSDGYIDCAHMMDSTDAP